MGQLISKILLTLISVACATGIHAQSMTRSADSIADTIASKLSFGRARTDIKAGIQLDSILSTIQDAHNGGLLQRVVVHGTASPDGPVALNNRLALQRAQNLAKYISRHTSVPQSMIEAVSDGEDWADMQRMCHTLPADMRAKVDATIASNPDPETRERKLRVLDGGRIWKTIYANIMPRLRTAYVVMYSTDGATLEIHIEPEPEPETEPEPEPETAIEPLPVIEPEATDTAALATDTVAEAMPEPDIRSCRHWYLKTNVPAWAMLWINAAAEFEFADHWSAQLAVYYSGFNYFTGSRKFRTLAFMPELRWWARTDGTGLFANAHLGMAYYNVAFGGDKRYQDHNSHTPALGGGLGIGYRLPISASGRWMLEFSLGAGVYHLDYDVFDNRYNGQIIDRKRRTFFGIDNAAISVAYRFDLCHRKGGAL